MTTTKARAKLRKYASTQKASILSRFFKTGPGEYGEGDIFIGVKVPETRKVAKELADLPTDSILELLHSAIHEERLLALFLLIAQYDKGTVTVKNQIVKLYLKNTQHINNWDLVDLSAPKILGHWLLTQKCCRRGNGLGILNTLARSTNLWERRIAIVATYAFIRAKHFTDSLLIADILLKDPEDLIHKAVGWMLREVGKRDIEVLENFLRPRHNTMPRTMLRYAIEKFAEEKRLSYLKGQP